MSRLGKFISEQTPKFNLEVAEGYCYHRTKYSVEYLDDFIRDTSQNGFNRVGVDGNVSSTTTHLKYLGYRVLTPEETVKEVYRRRSSNSFDLAKSTLYLVEFIFHYGSEPEPRKILMWLPYLERGNMLTLSERRMLIMPVLADKVISVGDEAIFIDTLNAKYNFARLHHSVKENDVVRSASVVYTELFKNPPKKFANTTRAKSTVLHYLLAYYGYEKTMEIVLGFVPTPTYDKDQVPGQVLYESTGVKPRRSYILKDEYIPNRIGFLVPEEKNNYHVLYVMANIMYILDNFPNRISVQDLNDPHSWRRFMGEIIFSGGHGIAYLANNMNIHFGGLNRQFDITTIRKLRAINIDARCLIELLAVIYNNFVEWITTRGSSRKFTYNKTMEAESLVLGNLISSITLLYLDINKDEERIGGQELEAKAVDKIFKERMKMHAIFRIRNDKTIATDVEDSTDHLCFKLTSRVRFQESDFTNVSSGSANTSTRKKLIAEMAITGSILNLPKRNPTPDERQNPYVLLDEKTGTVLPHPDLEELIERTDAMLASTELFTGIRDINDDGTDDIEIDDGEDLYDVDSGEDDD